MACSLISESPLSKPMLLYCQLDPWEQISLKFELKSQHFHSRKCIWKCCLQILAAILSPPQCVNSQDVHHIDCLLAPVNNYICHQLPTITGPITYTPTVPGTYVVPIMQPHLEYTGVVSHQISPPRKNLNLNKGRNYESNYVLNGINWKKFLLNMPGYQI